MMFHIDLPAEVIASRLNDVFYLDQAQQTLVLSLDQRIADILAHIATERTILIGNSPQLPNWQPDKSVVFKNVVPT